MGGGVVTGLHSSPAGPAQQPSRARTAAQQSLTIQGRVRWAGGEGGGPCSRALHTPMMTADTPPLHMTNDPPPRSSQVLWHVTNDPPPPPAVAKCYGM